MAKAKAGTTKVLNQECLWRTGKSSGKSSKKAWPRLRVINGMFVLLTENEPIAA